MNILYYVYSDILRKTIMEQIAALLVLPNKLAIPLSEEVPSELLKTPEPEVHYQEYYIVITLVQFSQLKNIPFYSKIINLIVVSHYL